MRAFLRLAFLNADGLETRAMSQSVIIGDENGNVVFDLDKDGNRSFLQVRETDVAIRLEVLKR